MIALIGLFNMPVRAVTYPMLGEISSTNGEAKIYSMAGTTGHEAKPEDKNKSQHLTTLKNGDKVKVTISNDMEYYAEQYGEIPEKTEMEYEVTGLDEYVLNAASSTLPPATTSTIGRPNFFANSQSRVSCAGTAMIAPVP